MTDLILSNVEPALLQRVKRLAEMRGWSVPEALVFLLDRGLSRTDERGDGLAALDTRVLEEAISALERVPDDPGFALIGRAPPPPSPCPAPDQAVSFLTSST